LSRIEQLEKQLDSFDTKQRKKALLELRDKIKAGEIVLPADKGEVNLHCHTFFSYNSYGYSPSKFAYLSRKKGLAIAGIVDFDVLDGLEEFYEAAKLLHLKACVGMETRVFVPEFADKVINSPGEPGISYHMGIGFPTARLDEESGRFLTNLKTIAQQRNHDLMQRVNKYLAPATLDFDKDVLTLTPAGNPTERHICLAYARKAAKIYPDNEKLTQYWQEKLGASGESLDLPEGKNLINSIRAKTMKKGGVGYMPPDFGAFPRMEQTNKFILAAGGIPALTWLDGTSDGEKEIKRLIEVSMSTGVAALNVIPDRNYTAGEGDKNIKCRNLHQVVKLAQQYDLPLIVGTEMNSPGQKFVDDFAAEELKPLLPVFLEGAYIFYAHAALQRAAGLGYCSNWAKKQFTTAKEKNKFFAQLGRVLQPEQQNSLQELSEKTTPKEILAKIHG